MQMDAPTLPATATHELVPLRLTVRQALVVLNMSRSLFYERIKEKRLKAYRDGGRVFISRAEIARYVAACEAGK